MTSNTMSDISARVTDDGKLVIIDLPSSSVVLDYSEVLELLEAINGCIGQMAVKVGDDCRTPKMTDANDDNQS